LPFDSASEDANAPDTDECDQGLTPIEERCRSSALCFGSGEVPNNGFESSNIVPPGRMASLTFAERSIGLPTTPNIGAAYEVPPQIEMSADVTVPRAMRLVRISIRAFPVYVLTLRTLAVLQAEHAVEPKADRG
jgi:hypothetical protein